MQSVWFSNREHESTYTVLIFIWSHYVLSNYQKSSNEMYFIYLEPQLPHDYQIIIKNIIPFHWISSKIHLIKQKDNHSNQNTEHHG